MAYSIGFDIFARDRASKEFGKVGAAAETAGRRTDGAQRMMALGLAADGDRAVDLVGPGQGDRRVHRSGARVYMGMPRSRGNAVASDEQTDRLRHGAASSAHSWATRCFCSAITWLRCEPLGQP